jgi:hypothetical protein
VEGNIFFDQEAPFLDAIDNSGNAGLVEFTQGQPYPLARPTIARQGYMFQGWFAQIDGAQRRLVTEITPNMLGNITLYGVFRGPSTDHPANQPVFEVVFHSFRGWWPRSTVSFNPPTLITANQLMQGDIVFETYLGMRPDRGPNFMFSGWFTDSQYSGEEITRLTPSELNLNQPRLELWAKWFNVTTNSFEAYQPLIPIEPRGFFGMIMDLLENIFGDPVIGLVIIGATIVALIVLLRLIGSKRKTGGLQSKNATEILADLLVKQQSNTQQAQMNMMSMQQAPQMPMYHDPMMHQQMPYGQQYATNQMPMGYDPMMGAPPIPMGYDPTMAPPPYDPSLGAPPMDMSGYDPLAPAHDPASPFGTL